MILQPETHGIPSQAWQVISASSEVQVALRVVRQAAVLARRIQAEMISPAISKSDRSPVTVADFAIQALVSHRLMEAFPADWLVAEEDSSTLKGSPLLEQVTAFVSDLEPAATPSEVCEWIDRGHAADSSNPQLAINNHQSSFSRYWLLDPIDGTKGFMRGGQYAVALALMVDGRAQIGVLGCPSWGGPLTGSKGGNGGSLAFARRGHGTYITALETDSELYANAWSLETNAAVGELYGQVFTRLQVSDRSDPTQACLLRSFEAGHTNVDQISQFAVALGIQADPVLMDSQVKYALLAAGQGDLMLRLLSPENPNYREKTWDQAAGSLVVEEAGGRATDLDGKPFDFTLGRELIHNRGVLVSNGRLHTAALQALKTIGA